MPDIIRRRHLTFIPDDPNYDVSADEWNDSLVVEGGGTNGDLMVKNTGVADGWSFASTFGGAIDLAIANLTISGDLTVGGTTVTTTLVTNDIHAVGVDVSGNLSVLNATFTGTLIASNIQATGVDIAGNLSVGGTILANTQVRFLAGRDKGVIFRNNADTLDLTGLFLDSNDILNVGAGDTVGSSNPTNGLLLDVGAGLVRIGGTTSAWPALAPNGAKLMAVRADQSDFTAVQAAAFEGRDYVAIGSTAPGLHPASTGTVRLPNVATVRGRNATDNADIDLFVFSGNALTFPNAAFAPTAAIGTSTTQLATTQFVMQNMATAGAGNVVGPVVPSATNDVVTFADTTGLVLKDSGVQIASLAPLASPAFTGVPTAPTAAPGTATTQLATTAFVFSTPTINSPTLTGVPIAPTAAVGTNTTQVATTAFVRAALGGSQVVSLTGTQNDLALTAGVRLVRCTNATKLTITGMSAGYDGQLVTIMSIGNGEVHFAHEHTGSVAGNRYINVATSTTTPLAPNIGRATYIYDAMTGRWRLTGHDQGSAIPYAAVWGALGGSPTTAPVIGDGTITASYLLWGKVIDLFLQIDFGPGTTYGNGYWTISVPAPLAGTSPVGTGFITTPLTLGGTAAQLNHPVICTIPANEIVVVLTSSEHNVGGLNVSGTDPTSPNFLRGGDVMRVALASYPIA
jgi:hypothetical protein